MVEPNNNSLKEWALYYASLGLAVFPLKPKGKAPAINNGFHRATTDPKQIKSWWENTPDFNIGIATGQPSGLLAIDLDIDDEKGVNGYEDFKILAAEPWGSPRFLAEHHRPGWVSLNIRGLRGLYRSKTGLYGTIVDIRANGGYIVAPWPAPQRPLLSEWETSW